MRDMEQVQAELFEEFKNMSRDELLLLIWKLRLQNTALFEYSEKQKKSASNRLKMIKRLKLNLRNQEVISARLSHEAHGG